MGSLINDSLVYGPGWTFTLMPNDWNAAYRSETIDRHSGSRSRDSEVVIGSLIDGGN
jgi:hypothetical protein